MRPVTWTEFRAALDADPGDVPDAVVAGTSLTDWQALLDEIAATGWPVEYVDGSPVPAPAPRSAERFLAPGPHYHLLRVWPWPGVQVNVWFRGEASIEFDIDPRELRGEDETEAAMDFVRLVGMVTGRPVRIMPDGEEDETIALFDPDADAFEYPARG